MRVVSENAKTALCAGVVRNDSIWNLELLGLSFRTIQLLEKANIFMLEELLLCPPETLMFIRGMTEDEMISMYLAMGRYDTLDNLKKHLERATKEKETIYLLELLGVETKGLDALEFKHTPPITTMDQLLAMTREDMLSIPNFANKTVINIMLGVSRYAELETLIPEHEREIYEEVKAFNVKNWDEKRTDIWKRENTLSGWDLAVPGSKEESRLVCPAGAGDSGGDGAELRYSA